MKLMVKIISIIKFAFDNIINNFLMVFLVFAMTVVGIYMMDLNISNIYALSHNIIVGNKVVDKTEYDLYLVKINNVISTNEWLYDAVGKFKSTVENTEGVDACGYISEIYLSYEKEKVSNNFLKFVKANSSEDNSESNRKRQYINGLYVSPSIIDVGKMSFYEGGYEEFKNPKTSSIIIGYELREYFNVGDEITFGDSKFKVVGILKKDSYWFSDKIFLSDFIDLDKRIIVNKQFSGQEVSQNYIVKAKEIKNIDSVIDESGLSVSVNSFNKEYKKSKNVYWKENRELLRISLFFMVISLIGIISATAVVVMINIKEYAIMNAFGFSNRYILVVLFVENIAKTGLAAILSYCYSNYVIQKRIAFFLRHGYQDTATFIKADFHENIYPFVLLVIVFLVSIIANYLPKKFLYRKDIMKIIGGNK